MNKKNTKADSEDLLDVKEVRAGARSSMLFGVIALLAVVAAGFFFLQYQNERSNSPEATAERNQALSNDIVGQLGAVLLLDEEAEPTVATIDDANSLREANADFYENAQDGDYLILYPQRAIIFRDTEDRVVNIAPIISTGNNATPAETPN